MSAERIYRLLLRAYPPDFRGQYEREMVLLFRDQCRESDVRTVGFWAAVIVDVARSAPALRMEACRESTRTLGVIMKLAAMLTLLVGVLGIVNAMVEWGAALTGTIGGIHSSVWRGMPSFAAAPRGPATLPCVSLSADSINAFSPTARVVTAVPSDGLRCFRASHDSSITKVSPSLNTTARSITFWSSRTLPGQS